MSLVLFICLIVVGSIALFLALTAGLLLAIIGLPIITVVVLTGLLLFVGIPVLTIIIAAVATVAGFVVIPALFIVGIIVFPPLILIAVVLMFVAVIVGGAILLIAPFFLLFGAIAFIAFIAILVVAAIVFGGPLLVLCAIALLPLIHMIVCAMDGHGLGRRTRDGGLLMRGECGTVLAKPLTLCVARPAFKYHPTAINVPAIARKCNALSMAIKKYDNRHPQLITHTHTSARRSGTRHAEHARKPRVVRHPEPSTVRMEEGGSPVSVA